MPHMPSRKARLLSIAAILSILGVNCCASSGMTAPSGDAAGSKQLLSSQDSAVAAAKLPTIAFEKIKLKNGLEVILSEDHRLPLVSTNLWYHVGPANEVPGRTGFAHLFEHMMFEGSKHVGAKAHFKYLEGAGASLINGTTDFDRTNYFETLPSNQLELALWLESDRMGFLLETLDNEKLTNQRDVVRNERRQSVENHPYGLVEEALNHELFPKGHPYYASVIGSHADIEAARINDVRAFFKQFYTPNNASLAIVGDFDSKVARALVEKYFGSIPSGPAVPPITVQTPPITTRHTITVEDKVELPRLYMSWLTAPIYKPGDAEADLAAHILGGGKSSRLYKKLVYEDQIAQNVHAGNQGLMLGSIFSIEVTAKPGVKLERLEKIVNDEIAAFRKDGPSQEEVDGARNTIEKRIITGLERLGGFGGVADRLNEYNYFLGDPGYLPEDLARYDHATTSDVRNFADKYLTDNTCVVVNAIPGKKTIEDTPRVKEENEKLVQNAGDTGLSEAWRATAPQPGPVSTLLLPTPIKFKLANGLTVFLHERHNLPVIAANLTAVGGSSANPADKPGLSYFTADMLDEGTNKRSTLQIAHDLDRTGTSLSVSSGPDSASASILCLTKTADTSFDLLSDIVLHPAFEPKEIERLRNDIVTSLAQDKDDPNKIARRVLYRQLYGTGNPMGYDERGTVPSIKGISREDMLKFWQGQYLPGNSALSIAGDLTEAQARALAEKYFGNWQGSSERVPPVNASAPTSRAVYIVDKAGAPQTALAIGSVALSRSNPDYVSTRVLNSAFGGMFSSRLNMNLREKHGYTYGIRSRFNTARSAGPFAITSSVRTDVTGPALSEAFNELEAVRSDRPITDAELKAAKDNYMLSLPGLFENSSTAAGTTSDIFVYDLPLDYYRKLPGMIDATTTDDLKAVAQKYLQPDKMIVSLTGDKTKIEEQIKPLNLGPMHELDFECNPVK